jgi:uncharacterized oxidoreductase
VDALVAHVKASPPADPSQPVLVAGEPERLKRAARMTDGVYIDDVTWSEIVDGAATIGLDANELLAKLGGPLRA